MLPMNTKRIIFWASFIIILALIIWGLVVAMNKPIGLTAPKLGTPAPVTSSDHVRGSASSTVTVIEYSDFQCPACAAYYSLVEKLVASSTNASFVYRHFPLSPLPHKNAMAAAQASEAANMQGKFFDMYKLLFENQTAWENSDTAPVVFEGYAQRIGLNMSAYKKDVDSVEVKARVQRDRDEGDSLGINGTPTFFIDGKAITNPNGYEAFKALIDSAASGTAN